MTNNIRKRNYLSVARRHSLFKTMNCLAQALARQNDYWWHSN